MDMWQKRFHLFIISDILIHRVCVERRDFQHYLIVHLSSISQIHMVSLLDQTKIELWDAIQAH